ncbi:hypothetical protein [Shimia abyssi]|uniref:Type IV pilus biogenesis protein PilP n=1 Tax=Shimia abyssi TaxID=1662395 RepID=A0A2P8F5Y5_9RHOB|nr:hypothetical protein [Shimia abyssi]PSL17126.1 hypothetical protein CLV88_12136 [Shimia abyssi]
MKPNFALSLSFEGISLLYRVAEGWHLLGEVALDSEDLSGELAKLRQQGEELAQGLFTTAVVVPNEQIKYLSLDTGRIREAKRRDAAVQALEEATPYKAHELRYDLLANGRTTQVAAVARETLDEALSFANEHAFNPVIFTAIPAADTFAAAPNFGPTATATKLLNGTPIEIDTTPISIVASGPLPLPETPAPRPQTPEKSNTEPAKPVPDTDASPEVASTRADRAEDPVPEAPVSFASIRARRDTPAPAPSASLSGTTRTSTGANAPNIPDSGSLTAERSVRFDPARVAAGLKHDAGPLPDHEEAPPASSDEPTDIPDSSFFSRRGASKSPPRPRKNGGSSKDAKHKTASEKQRLTVFGARSEQQIGGKPRYLGLIMTIVLLIFFAAVALWATVFLEDGVAGLFKKDDSSQIVLLEPEAAVVPDQPIIPTVAPDTAFQNEPSRQTNSDVVKLTEPSELVQPLAEAEALNVEATTPSENADITDSAEAEALANDAPTALLSDTEAEARYAVTGIWQLAPLPPETPTSQGTEDIYVTSIDRVVTAFDAVALPSIDSLLSDQAMTSLLNPVAPGSTFDLDDRGVVTASAQGTLNPEGVMVFLGRPVVLPPSLPDRSETEGRALSRDDELRIAAIRPQIRPTDLIESNQRATLGGLSRQELASLRPNVRPLLEKEEAEADTTATELAVLTSVRPRQRPSNIAQLAQRSKPSEPVVAVPAAATLTPKIPSTASVARQATIQNAINLNRINLIGVYGTSSNRRALVRLASGRYKKVQVGDRIDGGKVAAIGEQELRYIKSGKNFVLKMPKS